MAAIFFALTVLGVAGPARADLNSVSAREVARNNNCPPKTVNVFQQTIGGDGATVFRVDCNMPKVSDEKAPKLADALLIRCRDNLCAVMRPMNSEKK